jgi:hypothetical protein
MGSLQILVSRVGQHFWPLKDFFAVTEKSNAELIADIKNFTDIEPIAWIIEVSMQE